MKTIGLLGIGLIVLVLLTANSKGAGGALGVGEGGLPAEVAALQLQVTTLRSQLTALQNTITSANAQNALALGQYVMVSLNADNRLMGPNVVFHSANFHFESGSGNTVDSTGLGNLVIG